MNKSVVKNYIYNLMYQILTIILPIVTTPYISRVLGAENIGIYSYTISIVTYFILVGSLGIATYGQREIAYHQKQKEEYSKAFWEISILKFITMLISMIVFYFTFCLEGQYQIYYKILLLEMLANCFDISWFFNGLEEFKKTVMRNIIVKTISVISIFIFVKSSADLYIYFTIYVLSTIIGNISLWTYLPKYIEKIKFKNLNIKRHIKPTFGLFIPQIGMQVYTVLNKTMLGSIIQDKSEAGYYEQSDKIIRVLLTLITSLGTVMAPRIANTIAEGKKEQMQQYIKESFNFVFFISMPLMFGIINISSSFVPMFFGPGYEKVIILMNILSLILLVISLSSITATQYLVPVGKHKQLTISIFVGAIVNLILNLLLIKKRGAIGAAIGTVVAETAVTVTQMYMIRKEIDIWENIKLSKNYVFAAILMFTVNIILSNILLLENMLVQIVVGGIVYIATLVIIKDKFIYRICELIRRKKCTQIT